MNQVSRHPRAFGRAAQSASDALWGVYWWMTLGIGVTGVVALLVAATPSLLAALVTSPMLLLGLVVGQVVLVIAFSRMAMRVSTPVAAAMFLGYAALTGITLSTIFVVYTATSIATTFFVTAGGFAGLAAFGTVTKRDLSAIGRFAIFALVGLMLAMVVNFFLGSTLLQLGISVVGVVLFAALTAYDTQKLKEIYASGQMPANFALVGALTLYLDFINLFMFLLRLLGNRRSDY